MGLLGRAGSFRPLPSPLAVGLSAQISRLLLSPQNFLKIQIPNYKFLILSPQTGAHNRFHPSRNLTTTVSSPIQNNI
jgi:hypothetical protein